MGFLFFITPFMEQTAVWGLLTSPDDIDGINTSHASYSQGEGAGSSGTLHGLYSFPPTMGLSSGAAVRGNHWFNMLPGEYQTQISQIPWFFCPSRRSGGAHFITDSATATNGDSAGPQHDYVPLVSVQNGIGTGSWPGWCTNNKLDNTNSSRWQSSYDGPFRAAVCTFYSAAEYDALRTAHTGLTAPTACLGDGLLYAYSTAAITGWGPRDGFAYWADGASNQLCVVEKHIPQWAVNTKNDSELYSHWDGGNLMANAGDAGYGVLLIVTAIDTSNNKIATDGSTGTELVSIARGPNETATAIGVAGSLVDPGATGRPTVEKQYMLGNGAAYGMGSSHVGIVNVLLGDGVVRGIPVETSQYVLTALTKVNDGQSITLP
jgi:hypothetical protein